MPLRTGVRSLDCEVWEWCRLIVCKDTKDATLVGSTLPWIGPGVYGIAGGALYGSKDWTEARL